jgi:hypothetical protein
MSNRVCGWGACLLEIVAHWWCRTLIPLYDGAVYRKFFLLDRLTVWLAIMVSDECKIEKKKKKETGVLHVRFVTLNHV